jgi:hypothetical protein
MTATVTELEALLDLCATQLSARVQSGKASTADISNAVKLLKLCNIKVASHRPKPRIPANYDWPQNMD